MIDFLVDFGIEDLERALFKLPFDHVHSEAVCQRSVNLKRFARLLLCRFDRYETPGTSIVEAISKFDEQNTDVTTHRDNHFAQSLRLGVCSVTDFVELCYAVDELCNCGTKICGELFQAVVSVFNGVVQKSSSKRWRGHTDLSQNRGDGDRVSNVGFPALTHLPAMGFFCRTIRALDQ